MRTAGAARVAPIELTRAWWTPDIRPPLDTLAVCMGLPQREATFDKTRIEALAIALVLATALAFSAYRMVILKRCVRPMKCRCHLPHTLV